jgi:hypothetical protein
MLFITSAEFSLRSSFTVANDDRVTETSLVTAPDAGAYLASAIGVLTVAALGAGVSQVVKSSLVLGSGASVSAVAIVGLCLTMWSNVRDRSARRRMN